MGEIAMVEVFVHHHGVVKNEHSHTKNCDSVKHVAAAYVFGLEVDKQVKRKHHHQKAVNGVEFHISKMNGICSDGH